LFDAEGIPEWPTTFGFKLVESKEAVEIPHWVKGSISLFTALFTTMLKDHDVRYIKDEQFVRTIVIPTPGIGTTEFDITSERGRALYRSGWEAAARFFDALNFTAHVNY